MSITYVLGQSWRSSTDWSGNDPRNNGKDCPDQAENSSCSGPTKSYADLKRKLMEFEVEDRVMLMTRTSSKVEQGSPSFHVSNLKKCYADEPLVMPLEGIHVHNKLQFGEEPVEIMEREIK
ncbi:hypothetical protein Tco_0605866 [Tanacetum coccineum]